MVNSSRFRFGKFFFTNLFLLVLVMFIAFSFIRNKLFISLCYDHIRIHVLGRNIYRFAVL